MINLSDMKNYTDYNVKLVIQIITDRVDGLISIPIIFTNYIYISIMVLITPEYVLITYTILFHYFIVYN